jgi:peptidoglycan/LPS O-acetylase OafA/YrhL
MRSSTGQHFIALDHLRALAAYMVLTRLLIWYVWGNLQSLAYWTIIGRIDQFALGIAAYRFSGQIRKHPAAIAVGLLLFTAFWSWFDRQGGFQQFHLDRQQDPVWAVIPTLEGIAYALLIVWYDGLSISRDALWSRCLAWYGELSYSIYLLHTFFVFQAARWIHENVMTIDNLYAALPWSVVVFLLMAVPAAMSYKIIELPFLRLRTRYIKG